MPLRSSQSLSPEYLQCFLVLLTVIPSQAYSGRRFQFIKCSPLLLVTPSLVAPSIICSQWIQQNTWETLAPGIWSRAKDHTIKGQVDILGTFCHWFRPQSNDMTKGTDVLTVSAICYFWEQWSQILCLSWHMQITERSHFYYWETSLKVGFVLMTKLLVLILLFKLFCVSKSEISFSRKAVFF